MRKCTGCLKEKLETDLGQYPFSIVRQFAPTADHDFSGTVCHFELSETLVIFDNTDPIQYNCGDFQAADCKDS